MPNPVALLAISLLVATATYLLVRYGVEPGRRLWLAQEARYDRVLRRQLLLEIESRHAAMGAGALVVAAFLLTGLATSSPLLALGAAAIAYFVPHLLIRHLEQKRRQALDTQLVDGLTTLASGVRAGLNLVQAMALVVEHHTGAIAQEFDQMLREYHLGRDLNQAMRSASDRIGSPLYRLTFTAIETHRRRGGDAAESMDRLAESVREIHRLEGKLDAVTSQSRSQATMMAVMPFVFLAILYTIDREGVTLLFTTTPGRVILLIAAALIAAAFLWIRKIMAVEI
ncbi:MAG: type II secretion system F family protein [Algisphaera sp.]